MLPSIALVFSQPGTSGAPNNQKLDQQTNKTQRVFFPTEIVSTVSKFIPNIEYQPHDIHELFLNDLPPGSALIEQNSNKNRFSGGLPTMTHRCFIVSSPSFGGDLNDSVVIVP